MEVQQRRMRSQNNQTLSQQVSAFDQATIACSRCPALSFASAGRRDNPSLLPVTRQGLGLLDCLRYLVVCGHRVGLRNIVDDTPFSPGGSARKNVEHGSANHCTAGWPIIFSLRELL